MDDANATTPTESQAITTPLVEPGIVEKLTLLFTNPTKLFESLQRKTSWWTPLIAIILVSIVAGLIAQPYIMPTVRQDTMAYLSKIPNMPEEAIQKANEQFDESAKLGPKNVIITIISAFIMRGIAFFIVVTAIFLVGSIFFGGVAKYPKVMSMYSWVFPIWIIGIIVTTPLMIIKGSHNISLSPAALVTPDPFSSVFYFLRNLSFFNIWAVIVIGIGFSVIYGISRTKGIVAMLILWAVWIVINSFIPYFNFQMALSGLT